MKLALTNELANRIVRERYTLHSLYLPGGRDPRGEAMEELIREHIKLGKNADAECILHQMVDRNIRDFIMENPGEDYGVAYSQTLQYLSTELPGSVISTEEYDYA